MKKYTPERKYLFTWADGIVGKPGYVYQAANFLYGGHIWSDVYVTKDGEKIHPRTIQGKLSNSEGLKYGSRPNFEQRIEMGLSRVYGKQFRYIYPLNKKARKYLKESTVEWGIKNYPKDADLQWKILKPGEKKYNHTSKMPYDYKGDNVKYNSKNVNKISDKHGTASLKDFLS